MPYSKESALSKINTVPNIRKMEDVINARISTMFHLIYCAFLKNLVAFTRKESVLIAIIHLSSMSLRRNVGLMDVWKLFLKDALNVDILMRRAWVEFAKFLIVSLLLIITVLDVPQDTI